MKPLIHVGLLVALSMPSVPAFADEIAIASGHIEFSWGEPIQAEPFALAGDRGFSLQAANPAPGFAATNCRPELTFDQPCAGGNPLALTVVFAPIGTATLDGVLYSDVGRDPSNPHTPLLVMNIVASATLPPLDSSAMVSGVFFLDGPLNRFRYRDASGAIQTDALIGSGIATFSLRRHPSSDEWVLDGASLDFEPIPEPSTVLLFAVGAATMVARRRKARLT